MVASHSCLTPQAVPYQCTGHCHSARARRTWGAKERDGHHLVPCVIGLRLRVGRLPHQARNGLARDSKPPT